MSCLYLGGQLRSDHRLPRSSVYTSSQRLEQSPCLNTEGHQCVVLITGLTWRLKSLELPRKVHCG